MKQTHSPIAAHPAVLESLRQSLAAAFVAEALRLIIKEAGFIRLDENDDAYQPTGTIETMAWIALRALRELETPTTPNPHDPARGTDLSSAYALGLRGLPCPPRMRDTTSAVHKAWRRGHNVLVDMAAAAVAVEAADLCQQHCPLAAAVKATRKLIGDHC